MKLFLLKKLELIFGALSGFFETLRQKTAYCPDCGKNRYSSPPCVKD